MRVQPTLATNFPQLSRFPLLSAFLCSPLCSLRSPSPQAIQTLPPQKYAHLPCPTNAPPHLPGPPRHLHLSPLPSPDASPSPRSLRNPHLQSVQGPIRPCRQRAPRLPLPRKLLRGQAQQRANNRHERPPVLLALLLRRRQGRPTLRLGAPYLVRRVARPFTRIQTAYISPR